MLHCFEVALFYLFPHITSHHITYHTLSPSPAESMSISTFYIETKTNPVITPSIQTPPLDGPTLLLPHTDGTLTVWVRTPFNSGIGVHKVTEFEISILLEEMVRYKVCNSLLYTAD